MATRSKKQSSDELSAVQIAQKRAASYVPSHASTITEAEQQERLEIIERIPENVHASITHLATTNYQVDRSIREATLSTPDQWHEESEMLVFVSSDKLKVYLGTPRDPLEMSEALKRIRELSESTALTARIVLGLWNIRRSNNQLAKDGSIAMRLEEVLEWRGIKKHSYLAHPETPGCTKRYTDGYEARYKDQVLKDLDLLASCCVRGRVTATFKGKKVQASINGPYLNYSIVTYNTLWTEEAIAGAFISPGAWVNAYAEYDNYFLAEIDRKIFQFHPQNQQYELRLALYLTERWRQLAREGNFDKELSMADLLASSMIRVDKANLTYRFAPRIQKALDALWERGIIGAPARCTTPVDISQSRWGNAWLASRWVILPPSEVQQFYKTTLQSFTAPDRLLSRNVDKKKKTNISTT